MAMTGDDDDRKCEFEHAPKGGLSDEEVHDIVFYSLLSLGSKTLINLW